MVTTLSAPVSRSSVRPPVVRPPTTAIVGVGAHSFRVPLEALEAEYPLFGIHYETIWVPRLSRWYDLRAWLAIELRQSGDAWQQVWVRCQNERPSLWHRCAVTSLIKQSRSLPAGELVFEVESDFLRIPEPDLAHLPPRERAIVERCFSGAMRDFPDARPLELLRPFFVSQGGHTRLAQSAYVQDLAGARHDDLARFCKRHGHRVRLSDSPLHHEKSLREYELQRRELLHGALKITGRGRSATTRVKEAVDKQVALIAPLAQGLGIDLSQFQRSLTKEVLIVIDPVIVVEEPAWRLPEHDSTIRLLRTVVHWDDNGVTLLRAR